MKNTSKQMFIARQIEMRDLALILFNFERDIRTDIVYEVISAYLNNKKLLVKDILLHPTRSEMGVRNHLSKLVNEGLVELKTDPKDKRLKLVLPTADLMALFDELYKTYFKLEQELAIRFQNNKERSDLDGDPPSRNATAAINRNLLN